jgi:hypothetical protein
MTSLQLFILATIHRHGPQSNSALWHNTKCEPLPAIAIATATLEEDGFIEHTPAHKRPYRFPTVNDQVTYWQLTEQGQRLMLSKQQELQQEVCLGSK